MTSCGMPPFSLVLPLMLGIKPQGCGHSKIRPKSTRSTAGLRLVDALGIPPTSKRKGKVSGGGGTVLAAAVVNKQGGGRLESASGGPEIKIKFGWSKKLKFCKKLDSIMSRKTGIQRTVNGPRAEF